MIVFKLKNVIRYIFFILFLGCSVNESSKIPENIGKLKNLTVYPANTSPAKNISFRQDKVYGSAKDVLVGKIGDITIDDSGRCFIADGNQNTIHVFDSNASYLTHIGRKGKGPGEFYRIKDLQIKDHKLFAYDLTQFRYHVFSLDSLSFRYTVNLGNNKIRSKEISDTHLNRVFVRSDSRFLAIFTKNFYKDNKDWGILKIRGLYYLLDKNGNITSQKLLESQSQLNVLVPYAGGATDQQGRYTPIQRMGYHPGFYGKALLELTDDNHIFWAWTKSFLIKVYNPEGEYQRAIYYQPENVPLTRETATEAGIPDFILKGWQSMKLPKYWPALKNLKIDDKNRLWISTIVKDFDVYQWWVLKDNGELLARFTWPRNRQIEVVKNGYLYARETDEATGLQQIVRYQIRIEMKE